MNLLGIDYGTTSVKAVLFDEDLNQLATFSEDYTLITKGDTVEFPAEKYWGILESILKKVSAEHKVDALAIDTQCETLILADDEGNPLSNAIVWLDNRATKEAEEIEAYFGRKKVYEVTGQPEVTATWPASKLIWVKKNLPQIWEKTKKVFLLEDFLLYKLTGKFVTEKTLQSSSLYFDVKRGDWWDDMLSFMGVDRKILPEILDSGVFVGEYQGIKVVTSSMDQVAGAVGAGVIEKGIISEMTGTTMAIFMPTDEMPPFDENSIVPCHVNYDGGFALLSWSPTAGMALKWLKNTFFSDKSFRELDDMAKSVSPGCDGLVFLPYLCGSTMPKYNPDARGSFTGLTTEHTASHFVRSVMESVAFILKSNLDYLGVPVEEIRAMGGGATSPLWCEMKADVTGKKLITLKNKETACLGSAILAGVGCGAFGSVREACKKIFTDKEYISSGTDYSAAYSAFENADNTLNVRRI